MSLYDSDHTRYWYKDRRRRGGIEDTMKTCHYTATSIPGTGRRHRGGGNLDQNFSLQHDFDH